MIGGRALIPVLRDNSVRILVVEDERRLAHVLKQGLGEHGYAADVVYDGEAAFKMAMAVDYDCVILDLMLPRLDGAEVCRQMRAEGNGRRPIKAGTVTAADECRRKRPQETDMAAGRLGWNRANAWNSRPSTNGRR